MPGQARSREAWGSSVTTVKCSDPGGGRFGRRGDALRVRLSGTGRGVPNDFETMLETMRRAAAVLRDAEIPFALAGSVAIYARGGADTRHDVDFLVKPDDADRALEALGAAGFRPERPPEGWLFKAFDANGVMVDLIFRPAGGEVDDE